MAPAGVCTLRTLDDAWQLRADLAAARSVAIICGGLTGLERAATARRLGKAVTVIEQQLRVLVRPNMRFVEVKSQSQQAGAMVFRTRDLLVRQRTQLINALRGHLAEHGVVAPQGVTNVRILEAAIEEAEHRSTC